MSIRPLPLEAAERIKSSALVTSLNGTVCGLLCNSLDAEARRVNVVVDYARGNCSVEDDGVGIVPAEFCEGGGLGRAHHTSKYPPRAEQHGKNGEFLASLATLSLLSISSHHQQYNSHNSLDIHNSSVIARHTPASPSRRFLTFAHGTRVVVRDLFGSMPVRVKQRSVLSEKSASDREWDRLIRDVAAVVLSWPDELVVSIRDEGGRNQVRFKSPDGLLPKVPRILNQAGLVDSQLDKWIKVAGEEGNVSVEGCICLTPTGSKKGQFITLGIQPISHDAGATILYQEINNVFTNSSFAAVDEPSEPSRFFDPAATPYSRARRGVDRWPSFYFHVTVFEPRTSNLNWESVVGGRQRNLSTMIDLLKMVCYQFLKRHHFSPKAVGRGAASTKRSFQDAELAADEPRSRARSLPVRPKATPGGRPSAASPIDRWPRQKKWASSSTVEKQHGSYGQSLFKTKDTLVGPDGNLRRKPFEDVAVAVNETPNGSGAIPDSTSTASARRTTPLGSSKEPSKFDASEWVQKVRRNWVNTVFEPVEQAIPAINDESCLPDSPRRNNAKTGGETRLSFNTASVEQAGRISKQALLEAEVIAQVDKKFILVKLPLSFNAQGPAPAAEKSALVLIDQHAADERRQLESLMEGYFVSQELGSVRAASELLPSPLKFEVSARESSMLRRLERHFGHWGIGFKIAAAAGTGGRTPLLLQVLSLPPSILERCRQEPRLLIEMIRDEMWRKEDSSLGMLPQTSDEGEKTWVKRFQNCPSGIVDLLNSRACRSAIMFNDDLTVEECKGLVKDLARCSFPFQCAHGRPSLAPLVDLGSAAGWTRGWSEMGKNKR